MIARVFTCFIISFALACNKALPVNLPLTCIFSFESLAAASPTSSAWAWKTTLGGEHGRGLHLPAHQGWQDHCMIFTVEAEWLCACVGWGRTLHLCNGGAGALRCLPRVRNRAGNTQRGGGGEKREKSQEGKRDEGEGGSHYYWHTCTHTGQKHCDSPPPLLTHPQHRKTTDTGEACAYWLEWLQINTRLPRRHLTNYEERERQTWLINDLPISSRNQHSFPLAQSHSLIDHADLPINSQEPTSYHTMSKWLVWAETLISIKQGSVALK